MTSKVSSGALASVALYCAFLNDATWSSGTSTTISGSPSAAIETTGWPSATTWPASNFTAVTTPLRDARSTVYLRRLRARSSCFASASAFAAAVCAAVRARSSSDALTEPSALSASRRLRSDSAWRACESRGRLRLLRGFGGELVIGVVDDREHVAFTHDLADVDLALRDLAADAERLVDFVARAHDAGIAVRFAHAVVADFDGANGPQRLGGGRLRAAGGQHRGHRNDGQQGRGMEWFSRDISLSAINGFRATGSNACQPPPSDLNRRTLASCSWVWLSLAPIDTARRVRCASSSGSRSIWPRS